MKNDYDAIIIGAGISGLVCGCYLAKEGLRVLIIEQQEKVGGYCTSFQRGPYLFDAGVHYLGGISQGILGKIIAELGLKELITFNRSDPTDKIIMPDTCTYIRANPLDTMKEFQKTFPREEDAIERFFTFVLQDNFLKTYSRLRKISFKKLLDGYFADKRIKATLCMLLGNIGLASAQMSASTALLLFKEFILDPGYYPKGGMQHFPEALAECFKQHGGQLMLSTKAIRINTKDKKICAVTTDTDSIESDIVISNADATETFKHILDTPETPECRALKKLRPSSSIFALYLGLTKPIQSLLGESCDIWYSATYEPEKIFSQPKKNVTGRHLPGVMITFPALRAQQETPQASTLTALVSAPYESEKFWNTWRQRLEEKMLTQIYSLIPGIKDAIDMHMTATPLTFKRYTSNRDGAIYGWVPSTRQTDSSLLPQETSIDGLYLTGHWCTKGIGVGCVSGVASLGRNASRLILMRKNKRWNYPLFFRKSS